MRILEEVKVGNLVLKNRIIMPPMNTELATEAGEVTPEMIQHYSTRAPWLGLVMVEHTYVTPDGRLSQKQLGIDRDELMGGLAKLAQTVKSFGTPIGIQINHAGLRCDPALIGKQPVAPSAKDGARELTVREIANITEAFGKAAARAVRCGFDVVEVHGAHGFLLCEFSSPLANSRTDEYGGSLEKRMRFPLEVVRRVRRETGSGVQLWYRLGADDRTPGGNTVKEGARMAKMLAEERVDVLDVSGGMCGSRPEGLKGPGYFAYAAKAVKDATSLPVVAVGGITTPQEAEAVVRKWGVDLVAVGRAILKDPLWGKEAMELSSCA